MYTRPRIPVKQKHSPAGHTYNVCSRSCYKINKLYPWTYCDCIKKNREIMMKRKNQFICKEKGFNNSN